MVCPSCAAPLVPGARFCSSCGHAVVATQAEERRFVTVLFGDVVGFTSLAEQLDPEQVKRLIDGVFERLVEDVTAFGGRVDKLLGDGILALFGAPVAHEDDPERAVRAALRMQETITRYVADESPEHPLRIRIGINTGEVLVGTLAGTDYTAMGDVVNTASRLQAEAPPGGVLVGESTYALTSSVIDYGPPTELQPRGREQSVTTWLAVGALTAPGARVRRSDLRLVGRDPELGLARAALDLSFREHRTLLLNVVGESGVGKSRLIDELLDTLDEIGAAETAVAGMQQALSQQLKQKEHLAALGLAVSKINHDLRNMLAAAQLMSDRLGAVQDPTVQRFAPKLVQTLDRAIAFCQSTLSYGRADERPPRLEMVRARDLLDEVRDLVDLGEDHPIRWDNRVPADAVVYSDPEHLFRIFVNLCRNAVQAMEAAPPPAQSRHRLSVTYGRDARGHVFEISDTGPGVPKAVRERLFEAFRGSARPGGTGLGLAIAADLARALGGSIALVESGVGASFRLVLPAGSGEDA